MTTMLAPRSALLSVPVTLALLWGTAAGCRECEPCGEYAFALFEADEMFEPGTYRIELTLDDATLVCDVDANSTVDCGGDTASVQLHDDRVDIVLAINPGHIDLRVEQLDGGIGWVVMGDLEDRSTPNDQGPECGGCSYRYIEGALALDN